MEASQASFSNHNTIWLLVVIYVYDTTNDEENEEKGERKSQFFGSFHF